MEREQFVAVDTAPWWLLERDLDFRFEDLRRRLGASFGWTDPMWYTERIKLEEVHAFLLQQGGTFFYDLQQASDDYRREQWVESVIKAKGPSVSTLPSSDSPAPRAGHAVAGSSPAGSGPMSVEQEDAPRPRRSAFGAKPSSPPATAAADPGTAAPPSTPAPKSPFGEKRQPNSAATPAASAATPARKSVFATQRQPKPSGVVAPDGPSAPGTQTASTSDEVHRLDEQIKTVVSGLSADDLSAIAADLGLTPEEVEAMIQEDDFAALVAQEQTQLAS